MSVTSSKCLHKLLMHWTSIFHHELEGLTKQRIRRMAWKTSSHEEENWDTI